MRIKNETVFHPTEDILRSYKKPTLSRFKDSSGFRSETTFAQSGHNTRTVHCDQAISCDELFVQWSMSTKMNIADCLVRPYQYDS